MFHVTAKVASTLLIGVAAATVTTALPLRSANAACLTESGADGKQGKHWYYHIERGTGRHCWYVRGQEQDDKSARDDDDKQAAADKAPASDVAPAAARTFADAHAEIAPKVVPQNTANTAPAAPSVWPAPTPQAAPAAAADNGTVNAPAQAAPDSTRWLQSTDASSASSPAAPQQPDATLMTADAQDNSADATTDATSAPAAIPAPPERQMGSIQKLAMVAFGALALAGLTGSAVYRLGRRRRRNDWLRERNAWQNAQNPNRPPWVDEPRLYANQDVADLDDPRAEDEEEWHGGVSLAMNESEDDSEPVEKIEDFLARLTHQLHQQREGARPQGV
jgi:hypothetical protein